MVNFDYIAEVLCIKKEVPENQWTPNRPDGHAPINVMGDHYHNKGEWMFSYRIMSMGMEGARSGTKDLSLNTIHQNYMVAPQKRLTKNVD